MKFITRFCKSLAFLLFVILLNSKVTAQNIGDYRSVATGNWNANSTWQRCVTSGTWTGATNVFPPVAGAGAGVTITISSPNIVTVNGVNVTNNSTVVIAAGGTLTVSVGRTLINSSVITNNGTLTTNTGILTNNATINNNGAFTNSGTATNASIINNNAAGTLTHGGTAFTNNAAATINNAGSIVVNATKILNNNGIVVNSGTVTNSGTFNFTAGSLYQHSFTGSGGTVPTATWNTSSTCEILSSNNVSPAGLSQAFGNFTWNNTLQTANIDLAGSLGTNIVGVGNPAIAGDLNMISTGSAALVLKGTSAVSFTIGDSIKISSGTLILNGGTGAFGVTLTGKKGLYQTGGTLNLSSSTNSAGNGYFNVNNCFTHLGGTICETGISASSQINVNGSTAATIESIGLVSGNSIQFNIQESSATGITTINSGKNFIINPGTDFYVYDNGATSSDLVVAGTLTANTNTWTMASGVTAVNGLFLNNSLTIGTSSPSTLIVNAGGIFRQAVNGGQVAVASWMPTSNLEITGVTTCDSVGNGNQTFGNIIWDCPSQTSSAYFGRASSTGNLATQTDFTVTSTGSGRLRFPDFDFTIGNDLIVQNSSTLQLAFAEKLYAPATRTFTVTGNVNIIGSAILTVGSPNTGASMAGGDQYRDFVFSLKKNFVHSSSANMISQIHKSYVGATNDEEYRLVLNYDNGITQYLTMTPSASGTNSTFTGDGVANSGTDDQFSYFNIYKINVTNAGTHLKALSNLKYNIMTVGATNTADTLDMTAGTYNLIHFPSISVSGAAQGGSTTISGNAAGSGILDFGFGILTDDAGSGTFTLSPLAELKTKHVDGITPVASGAVGCIRTATRTYNPAGNYTYNGTSAQVTGTGLPGTLTGILEIDNSTSLSSGGVTLSQATAINGGATMPLLFTTGKLITTATNLITINNGSVVSPAGGSATSFVDGPISKVGFTANVEFVYPTGDTAKWARIGFTAAATSTTLAYTAEYFKRDPHTNVDPTFVDSTLDWTNIKKISYQEYWSLAKTGATTGNGKVKLYWESSSFSGITSASATDLRVVHFKTAGPKWFAEGTTPVVTASTIETQAVVAHVASYPYFTFGAPNTVNPLPVELLSFEGKAMVNGNQLMWSTASETNNNYFDIERSQDASNFVKISSVNGNGTSTTAIDYEKLDPSPVNGMNYYRLKQVDFDGNYTYSSTIAIDNGGTNSVVTPYPNPTVGTQVTMVLSSDITGLTVYNVLGEVIYSNDNIINTNSIELEVLSKGVYIVKAVAGNKIVTTKFTKN